jgi:anti-sigma regulatory factor (Ser/Thr protein kinase)
MQSLTVPGILDSLSEIGQFVNAASSAAGLDKKVAYRLRLAVDEIATNIIIHGYEEAGLSGSVRVVMEMSDAALTITLEDSSGPFDPRAFAKPDHIDKPIEERPIGGLGVFLSKNNVDRFDYEYQNGHNRNIFIINRPTSNSLVGS